MDCGHDQRMSKMEVGASSPVEDAEASTGPTRSGDVESFPLYRQSSIYSLTLEEFQDAVCEPGKNFGSMNMDEFLNNIWTAEENQALTNIVAINNSSTTNAAGAAGASNSHSSSSNHLNMNHHHGSDGHQLEINTRNNILPRQSSGLHRQGSLTLPAPLCRKTVEEVWSEIHRQGTHGTTPDNQDPHPDPDDEEQEGNHLGSTGAANTTTTCTTTSTTTNSDHTNPPRDRQPTFGEMTLEDFLIKAGVVREGPQVLPPERVVTHTSSTGTTYVDMGVGHHLSAGDHNVTGKRSTSTGSFGGGEVGGGLLLTPPYQYGNLGRIGSSSTTTSGGPTSTGMVGFAGGIHLEMGRGSGSDAIHGAAMPSMAPPLPHHQVQYKSDDAAQGVTNNIRAWRKQHHPNLDDHSPVQKVVERRQRRMIKNRESAARSRARKQAYTVELEAELEQLRKENARLKKEQEEAAQRRKRKILEAMNGRMVVAAKSKSTRLRRTLTGPW